MVIWRRDIGLKSHPNDWRSLGSNPRPLVYKASSLTVSKNPKLDLVNVGVHTKAYPIMSIHSEDIEWKRISDLVIKGHYS